MQLASQEKYAQILISKGATVTVFDSSSRMVALAKERNKNTSYFFVQDLATPFKKLNDNRFDIIVCALAMQYIKDWNSTIQEFYRVSKENGQLIISIEHPFFEFNYFNSKYYFNTEALKCIWKGFGNPIEINSYRRSLESCIIPLTNNGLYRPFDRTKTYKGIQKVRPKVL